MIQNSVTGKKEKWEAWPHLLEAIDALANHKYLIIVKARQLGLTWLLAAYALWKALFVEGIRVLMTSLGEDEAKDFISKCKFIYNQLPEFMKPAMKHPDNAQLIDFQSHESVIVALPSTVKAGHSKDAGLVIRDELAYHDYAEESLTALGPTVDSGGQMIDCSTVNPMDLNGHFASRARQARDGKIDAKLLFFGWRSRPVRDPSMSLEDWFKSVKRKYPDYIVERQYAETLSQALGPSKARAYFDIKGLTEQEKLALPPLMDTGVVNNFNGVVNVYQQPINGEKYVLFTDPSDGKEDPFHSVVMRVRTGEGVAEAHGMLPAEQVARIHDSLARAYNAMHDWELTGYSGGKFTNEMSTLMTPNPAPFIKPDGTAIWEKHGLWAGGRLRDTMLSELDTALRERTIVIRRPETVEEMKTMFIPEDGGKPEVPRHSHDDAIIAWAGAVLIRKFCPVGTIKYRSATYGVG